MTPEQRKSIDTANILATEYHNKQRSEYAEIKRISEQLINGVVTTPLISKCVGVCRLNAHQTCIGCNRAYNEILQDRARSDI